MAMSKEWQCVKENLIKSYTVKTQAHSSVLCTPTVLVYVQIWNLVV